MQCCTLLILTAYINNTYTLFEILLRRHYMLAVFKAVKVTNCYNLIHFWVVKTSPVRLKMTVLWKFYLK